MNQRQRLRTVLATVALSAVVLAGCGSSNNDSSSSTSGGSSGSGGGGASSGSLTVNIQGFKFRPADLKAKVNDTVTFTNKDAATHTATSESGAPAKFDTGNISQGQSKKVKLTKAGTYKYQCTIHDYMKGTISVS